MARFKNFTVNRFSVLLLLLLIYFGRGYAQTYDFKTTEGSAIVSGNELSTAGFPYTLTVWCNHFDYITSTATWRDDLIFKSNVSFVKFYVDNYNPVTKYQAPVNYTYRLICHVYGYTDPADTVSVFTVTNDTLTINYNNLDNNAPYQEINLKKYNNYYKLKIVIDAIFEETSPGTLVAAALTDPAFRNFRVEGSILSQCYDKREYGSGTSATAPVVFTTAYPASNYLQLSWDFASGPLAPVNYQLEWTYIDDYRLVDMDNLIESAAPPGSLPYNFAFNSTRVCLADNSFKIPLIYPRGYIVYRVRAVRPDSSLFKYPVYGKWSLPGGDEGIIGMLPPSHYYHIADPYVGDSLNWQYTVSFAEGGKYKNVASFYDGLLKLRQSITRFNTNLGKLIATNDIYDYEGRTSIKTLPAPIKESSFRYLHNVDLNSVTHLPYRAADFDTGSLRYSLISPLASDALASIYYSSQNPDTLLRHQKFVASAEGYPLVQTIFESGFDDRVSAQGGAGRALQIGDSNYVSNTYVNASQPAINSLFGIDVGLNSFYSMTVSQDPNQQYSMTIKDYHGKQIVSSLIGSGPSSATHALAEVLMIDSVHYKQDLLSSEPASQLIDTITGSRVADVDFFNQVRGEDSLQYFYQLPPYPACPDQNIYVRGHYTAKVLDKYGNLVLSHDNYIGANRVDTGTTPTTFSTPQTAFAAGIGTYHVNKQLVFSPTDVNAVLDSFFDVANCFYTLPYFIKASVNNAVFPCPKPGGLTSLESDKCANAKWEMMQQLFPAGEYSRYTMIGDSMAAPENSSYTILGCPIVTRYCYHPHAIEGGDSSVIHASIPTYGDVKYRCFCNELVIRDTCVYDSIFTTTATFTISGLDDLTQSVYVPFLDDGLSMTGNYFIRGFYNLGTLNGTIYQSGTAVGHISQSTLPRKTTITVPITVKGDSFIADLHGNSLTVTGDSFYVNLSGRILHVHDDSTYTDYTSTLCHRRYQDTCTVPTLADTITVNGVLYSGLRTISATDFTAIYKEAIASKNYSIAEALLPLHPQYCELKNCFTDSFKAQVFALPDWQTAHSMHLFYLDSLVAKDPLRPLMTSSGLFPDAADSLRKFAGGAIRLDSFIFMNAYCNCTDSIMFKDCYNNMFSNEISNHLLISNDVKKYYFKAIVGTYFANRQRFIDSIFTKDGNTCSHCSGARMTLIPSATILPFPVKIDTTISYPWFPSPWPAYGTDSFQAALDSLTTFYNHEDTLLCMGAINTLVERFSNCIQGVASVETDFRNALLAIFYAGQAPGGDFTHAQIETALTNASIPLSDLCNPYIYGPPAVHGSRENSCLSAGFYADAGSLLNEPAVRDALLSITSSHTMTLDTNHNIVHKLVARRIGNVEAVDVTADYDGAKKLYTVYIINPAAFGSMVRIQLHSGCGDVFSGMSSGSYLMSAACINTDRLLGSGTGHINQYGFKATVVGSSPCAMAAWIDRVETMVHTDNAAPRCMPCTQMRELYSKFTDVLSTYDVKGADHPFYAAMLTSFMNEALQQQYSSSDYETFIQSCALADSIKMPLYVGYSTFRFDNTTDMDGFINTLNMVNTDYSFDNCYRERKTVGGSPQITVVVDLNTVPQSELWRYKAVLETYVTTTAFTGYSINDLEATMEAADIIGSIHTDPDFPFSPGDSSIVTSGVTFSGPHSREVWIGGGFVMRHCYDVIKTGTAKPYDISRAVYQLTAYLYNHGIPGAVFIPHFKSTIDASYFKPEKQAYLAHTYGFQGLPDYEVLNNIEASHLTAAIPSDNAAYSRPNTYGLFSNLYLWNAGMSNRHYDTLQRIIDLASPSGEIFNTAASVSIPLTGAAQLNAYICADKSYWYRYFTTGDTLYNVYIGFPAYIPEYTRSLYKVAGLVIPIPSDSLNRQFAIKVVRPGTTDTLQLYGLTSFVIGESIQLSNALLRLSPLANSMADTFDNCERQTLYAAINDGIERYDSYIDSVRKQVAGGLQRHLVTAVGERLELTTAMAEQSYTLYNYDRAGNLTLTVPPAGVQPLPVDNKGIMDAVDDARKAGTIPADMPTYTKKNTYAYTSFNQVNEQRTINGGKTRFMYDAAGRLVFSQNAKQAVFGKYTYNIYDEQGRIVETGEAALGCPYFANYVTTEPEGAPPCSYSYPPAIPTSPPIYTISADPPMVMNVNRVPYADVVAFIRSFNRQDVVLTTYDTAVNPLDTLRGFDAQENLRKRVACVKYFTALDTTDTTFVDYNYASHYSYDAQGNVQTLTQDYPALATVKHRYKRIDYDYDLVSGKVNMLSYNRGHGDQFYQKYAYDADNRITDVQTSNDGYIWKKNAHYTYYEHGPLARVDLGDLRVQGIDYAYTIQGWLKVMNSDTLNKEMDMGVDGSMASISAYDAVAHTIDYFRGDYNAITGRQVQHVAPVARSLYNGNIARQTVAMDSFVKLNKQYVYDQLSRIISADYAHVDPATGALAGVADYHSRYGYDKDGNIQKLLRYGNDQGSGAQPMDSMSYYYADLTTDKLTDVYDESPDVYTNDIKQFPASGGTIGFGRYNYDAIGNTTSDVVSGQSFIAWNLYNKVTTAMGDTGRLEFEYDGMGNRVAKHYKTSVPNALLSDDEYYVHDAQGNILATYKGKTRKELTTFTERTDFALSGHSIYGSSRLGVKQYYGAEIGGFVDLTYSTFDTSRLFQHLPWYSLEYQDVIKTDSTNRYSNTFTAPYYARHVLGQVQYELTDHLGNVLATVSDKRAGSTFIPVPGGGPLVAGDPALINAYKPIVVSEQDYYPFGQHMPGRYKADTATHCIITNISTMLPQQYFVNIPAATAMSDITPLGSASLSMGGGVLTMTSTTGGTSSSTSAFAYKAPPASVATGSVVNVLVNDMTNDHAFIVIDNPTNTMVGSTTHGTGTAVGAVAITMSAPHSSDISVVVACLDPTGGMVEVTGFDIPRDTMISYNIPTNVCNNDFYHYGFNGKIKDNELAGVGNSVDYGFRRYDPRIARFNSVDPLAKKYHWLSGYQFAGNTPIQAIDIEGLEPGIMINLGPLKTILWLKEPRHQDITLKQALLAEKDIDGGIIDTRGFLHRPSKLDYKQNPFTATLSETGYIGAQFFGLDKIDKFGADLKDGNLSPVDAVIQFADIGFSTAIGEKGGTTSKGIHGNSKLSPKPQHLYEMSNDRTGQLLEYGLSGQELKENGTSPRVDQKIREKYNGNKDISGKVIEKDVPGRESGLQKEKDYVNQYKKNNNGASPPNQKRPK
ncbi:MAG: RHS repeat-associated core domain-containing protein [Bacteroidota bacterium]